MNYRFKTAFIHGFDRKDVINYIKKQACAMEELRQSSTLLEQEVEALQSELSKTRFDQNELDICREEIRRLRETQLQLADVVYRAAEELTALIQPVLEENKSADREDIDHEGI